MVFEPLTPERRRQQTRDFLLRAAEQVFAERGFYGASLDQVAAVAGFTKGAVYSNFKNKEDLFLALLESRYEQEIDAVRAILEATEGEPEVQLGDFVAHVKEIQETRSDTWVKLDLEFCLYAMRNPAVRTKLAAIRRMDIDSVAEIIEVERTQQGIETNEPAAYDARIAVSLMQGIEMMRMIDPESVDEAFLKALMRFLYRAFPSGIDTTAEDIDEGSS